MASERFCKKIPAEKTDFSRILAMREKLSELLKPERYEHSLSVSFSAAALAMRYGADLQKAEIAGLCHDCAKHFGKQELLRVCERDGLVLSPELLRFPQVIHSFYGEIYAEKLFGIRDPEILSAIRFHTLGRPGMSLLEKIIFTADFIELRRYKAAGLSEIRRMAFLDLDEAVYLILKSTIEYLRERGGEICRASLESYEYYRKVHEEKGRNADPGEEERARGED